MEEVKRWSPCLFGKCISLCILTYVCGFSIYIHMGSRSCAVPFSYPPWVVPSLNIVPNISIHLDSHLPPPCHCTSSGEALLVRT